MQIYCAMRGIAPVLDQWENLLLATPLPWEGAKMHPEVGKAPSLLTQIHLRPIRLYEIAFPEPQLQTMLNILKPSPSWNPKYDKYLWTMRKALGLKKIPELIPKKGFEWYDRNHAGIECAGIGLKEDRYEKGIEMI